MNTPLLILHFELTPLSPGLTGFELLHLVKSRFASAFRQANGCLGRDGACRIGSECSCHAVFGQQLASDPYALRRFQKPPLPFAFRLSAERRKNPIDAATELQLAIIGDAITHLDIFVKAVQLLSDCPTDSGGWRLASLCASAADGSRTLLPLGSRLEGFSSLPLHFFAELLAVNAPSPAKLRLDFHTPLRLMQGGSPLRQPSFSAVAGALFRRISSLAYYYGSEELTHDFKWLAERSRDVACTGSTLSRINRGGTLQGVEGTLSFRGDLAEFIPFIELGSRLNIGKGGAYGAGSYTFSAG